MFALFLNVLFTTRGTSSEQTVNISSLSSELSVVEISSHREEVCAVCKIVVHTACIEQLER